jgi:hypothetical protein
MIKGYILFQTADNEVWTSELFLVSISVLVHSFSHLHV